MIDWLDGYPRIRAGLAAITAAVVGVIANLSVWFAAHVIFDQVGTSSGIFAIVLPVWSSFNIAAAALTTLAATALIWRKWPLPLTLAVMAGAGIALSRLT